MEQAPIRLYLINGFLGSGKTTFLRLLIEAFRDVRLGVLVNEFGSIGIDGALVSRNGIQLVEVNRGSIFCACIKDGFVRTLKVFSQQPIDTLLIESSGMADPAGMTRILEGLASHLDRPYQYAGNICLVDCTTFADHVDILMPLQNQVASADFIIVNKTDLVDAEQLDEVHTLIRQFNREAPVYNTVYAKVPRSILEHDIQIRRYAGEGTNTPYNRPNTYTLLSDAKLTEEQLQRFCKLLSGKIFRFKGFLRNTENGFWYVDGVGDQYSIRPASFGDGIAPQSGCIVCISFQVKHIGAEVEAAWSACVPESEEQRAALKEAATADRRNEKSGSARSHTDVLLRRGAGSLGKRAPRIGTPTKTHGDSSGNRPAGIHDKSG